MNLYFLFFFLFPRLFSPLTTNNTLLILQKRTKCIRGPWRVLAAPGCGASLSRARDRRCEEAPITQTCWEQDSRPEIAYQSHRLASNTSWSFICALRSRALGSRGKSSGLRRRGFCSGTCRLCQDDFQHVLSLLRVWSSHL